VSKHDKVIRVANEWNAKHFKVSIKCVEIDIGKERRKRLALRHSDLIGEHVAELGNIDRQPIANECQEFLVSDPKPESAEQDIMIDTVKAFPYVSDNGPLTAARNNRSCDRDRLMGITVRTKAVAESAKCRLKDWLQNGKTGSLYNPVPNTGYAKVPDAAVRFWDLNSAQWPWRITS
jgi:hypothetical protein